jgi:hypothetical protein
VCDGLGSVHERERGAGRSLHMVGLVRGGVEDDHHGVAGEAFDHALLGRDDGDDLGPVRVQHRDHLRRARPL